MDTAWTSAPDARERLLNAAYHLFSRRGIQAVGIEAIISESGVARQTLYRHFASKDALVLAFLDRRRQVWLEGWLVNEVESRTEDPGERLLTIFDVFGEWFAREDFEGCSFINVMLETAENDHPVHVAAAEHLENIRAWVRGVAKQAGVEDPEALSHTWHLLMKGSIVHAEQGDPHAAVRAKALAQTALTQA
jgi:AcrR family transcriptional regulator